jgi:hypothetical protein
LPSATSIGNRRAVVQAYRARNHPYPAGGLLFHRVRFTRALSLSPEAGISAAISNASIATCHAVLSCSDLGRAKICRLASSSVRSLLPSGKTTGRSRRLSQDTTQLPENALPTTHRRVPLHNASYIPKPQMRPLYSPSDVNRDGFIDPSPASFGPNDVLFDPD